MEGKPLGEDALLWQLRDSRRRFQTRMQRLIEKYNQPFEDAPLVRMSTLTYETPQGLRIWGGGLVKEKNEERIQDSPVKTSADAPVSRSGRDPEEAGARGLALPEPSTRVPEVDSKSSDDASLCQEDEVAEDFVPAVPWSPLKDNLRRKYLTQVDLRLRDEGCWECTDGGDGEDTRVTLTPPLASPATPAAGHHDGASGDSPSSSPVTPAPRPCSADLAVVPRSDSLPLPGPGGHSFSSSLSFEPDDVCDVTISDLYAGMLHSMSRLLSTKPSCVISTKTSFVIHGWHPRSRRCRSRTNRTHGRGGGRSRRGSRERLPVRAEPAREAQVLRGCENVLAASGQKAGLKLGKASREENQPQVLQWDPSWKEFKGLRSLTPQRHSLLTYGDSSPVRRLDLNNRYKALKWLISPVKIVSRPRILPGKGGHHYREIEIEFEKLHQECCAGPGKQRFPTSLPESSAVDVYRGGAASPRGPRGFETRRLSGTWGTAEARRLKEALAELGERAVGAERGPQKRGPPPPLSETGPAQSPGRTKRTLVFQGNSLGTLGESVSPSRATSAAGAQPPSCGRDRYREIKERFDQLHQRYCQNSPPRTKALLRIGAPPGKASVEGQDQKGAAGRLNPEPGSRGPPKRSASPRWGIERPPPLPAAGAQLSPRSVLTAGGGHWSPPKRRRLSDSALCGQWAGAQGSSRAAGQPTPRPGERPAPRSPAEERRKEHIFQDGREK